VFCSTLARRGLCQESSAVRAHRIVLVGSPSNESTKARVRAELQSDGWQVVDVEENNYPLESVAQINDAIAVIRVEANPPTCEIWAASSAQQPKAGTEVIQGSPQAAAILAIQAVEVLRARLLKIGINAPKSTNVTPSPLRTGTARIIEGKVTPTRMHWPVWLGVGSALIGSRGGFSPNGVATISLSTQIVNSLTAGTRLWIPISAAQVSQPEGTTHLWLGSATGTLGYELGRPTSTLRGQLCLGAGGQLLRYGAEANPPYNPQSTTLITGLSFLAFDITQRLESRLRIGLGVTSGITWARPVLRVVGRDVAYWGRPFYAVGLQGEFDVVPN